MIARVKDFLSGLFGSGPGGGEPISDAAIQAEFKKRYHNFRLLLTANKKALGVMAEMENALRGRSGFGMSYVRSQATAASVNVFRIVKHLSEIAPGKYDALFERIREIQSRIGLILARQAPTTARELAVPLERVGRDMADQVGSKMANLGDLMTRLHLPVPPGFAITSLAYTRFVKDTGLRDEVNRLIQSVGGGDHAALLPLCSRIQQMIVSAEPPKDVVEAIEAAYRELEAKTRPGVRVSLRSSALGEDAHGQSFAGQFRSVLNVAAEDLIYTYKEILASKYSPQAVTYRLAKGIPDEDVAMCVGCMAMIAARSGGVAYSRNPISIRDDEVYLHASWGLAKTVVDGAVDSDLYVVRRGSPPELVSRRIGHKDRVFVCDPVDGICRTDAAGDMATQPCLTDEEALRLADLAIRLDRAYGEPLDIEWAMDEARRLYLLQCRPLQQIETGTKRPEGAFGQPLIAGGVTGSPGVGAGKVHAVLRDMDMLTFAPGSVVVAVDAAPRWATLLPGASALVAERGSSAGHLANVAREFGVPAIMGLPGAVQALKNAGEVTVDADGLAIYPGRIEALLALAGPKGEAGAAQSPMHAILREVLDEVAPLNLTDPKSPQFSPQGCRTLHDITRFCHEKSVEEMFRFGQDFHFSKRASKQLKYKVPMKWWFVNLDDGFTRDVAGKYVLMEEIACEPVHALWEGFTAVPWEGPPPMDRGGFISIVARSTANPNIDASMHSSYAQGNYFMISRHYMCLSSRFGYHFCTVEALVDDRENENYVTFQFKGGAAEVERRTRRAIFVGEMLEAFDFRVEIHQDEMQAIYAKGPMDVMLDRLRVLGYLLMHTRQLDMVMTNDALVAHYRQRFLTEIRELLRASGDRFMNEALRDQEIG